MEEYKNKKAKRYFNRIMSGTIGAIKMGAGMIGLVSSVPPAMAAGLTAIVSGGKDIQRAIDGEYIKDSMINATAKNRIVQSTTSPNIWISSLLLDKKQKAPMLIMQEMNFLLQADRYKFSKDGVKEPIKYNTRSQALTYKMLSKIQEQGFIENLERKRRPDRRLVTEKLMLGNVDKNLLKKEKFYDISFNITDKEITQDDILKMYEMSRIDIKNLDDKSLKVKKDKQGNIRSVNYNVFSIIRNKLKGIKDRIGEKFAKKKEVPMLSEKNEEKVSQKEDIRDQLDDMVNTDAIVMESKEQEREKIKEKMYEER